MSKSDDQEFCGEDFTEAERELFKFIAEEVEVLRRKAIMEIVATILNSPNVRLSALGLMNAADLTQQSGRSIAEWARHFEVSRTAIYLASKQWEQVLGLSSSDAVDSKDVGLQRGSKKASKTKCGGGCRAGATVPKNKKI